MDRRDGSILQNIDWFTVAIYFALVLFGWISIYGAVYNFDDKPFYDFSERYGKQLVWIVCGVGVASVLLMLDSRLYNILAYIIYGVSIVLLIVTIFVAPDIKGSHSWLVLGPVSLQPAEFAKTATCLALAKYLSTFGVSFTDVRAAFRSIMIIALPMLLIICQQETGSALAYLALFLVLYREGMPGLVLLLGVCAVVYFILAIRFGGDCVVASIPDESLGMFIDTLIALGITLLMVWFYLRDIFIVRFTAILSAIGIIAGVVLYKVFDINIRFTHILYFASAVMVIFLMSKLLLTRRLAYLGTSLFMLGSVAFAGAADFAFNKILQPHQQVRIKVTLGMENDPKKSGYNVNQSIIAIGSGQFTGKGFLCGTQTKLRYVPEQDTDFIFCTVGEEHGFIGAAGVILLFFTLIARLVMMAERQRTKFSRIYGYCVASIFFFHLAINVGMVIGLTPVIGIPLPFFSYGGSGLWSFTILLFIFIRLDASRKEYMQE